MAKIKKKKNNEENIASKKSNGKFLKLPRIFRAVAVIFAFFASIFVPVACDTTVTPPIDPDVCIVCEIDDCDCCDGINCEVDCDCNGGIEN